MDFNSFWLTLSGIKNLLGALGTLVFVSTFLVLSNCQALPPDDTSPSIQPGSGTQPSKITSGLEAYLPVDCLLPGQIRRLGSQVTYVTARRPIRTSANRCEIRGGEYVSYDRANYETALAVWLEKAKAGDAKAQTYVGEIYEKGMGRPPDYKEAAKWYQRGADQDYSPAQIKLGLLYEKGLGVDQNKEMALQLYRRASGLEDLGVQFGASTEIGKLKEDLIHQRNEVRERLLQLNHELEQLTRERKQLQEERESMEEDRKKLQEIERSKEELVAKDRRLAQKEQDLQGKEQQIHALSLKLENQKQSLEAQERDLFRKRQELTRQELDNPPENEKLPPMKNIKTEIGKLKEDLIHQRKEVGEQQLQLNHELEQLTRERKQLQEERERMEENRKKLQEIEQSKEELVAKDRRLAQKEQDLQGKEEQIDALSLKLKNQKQSLEAQAKDLFRKRQELTRQELDNPPENENLSPMKNFNIDYGKSYALIIGISKYKNLDPLHTAANDAKGIEKVLKSKYDFTHIDLLVDEKATYGRILDKLKFYQNMLGAQDNFLIYYAGHGKLENGEGFWLPVDADHDIQTQRHWIDNKLVSGLISGFKAKHVIIVADSCYSGAIATRGTTPWYPSDLSEDKQQIWLERMARKPGVRMSLTSGGLEPVYDNLGGSHSFFAEALLAILGKNTRKFLPASTVWNQVGNYMYGHIFPKKSEEILRGEGQAKFDQFQEPRYSSLNMSDQTIGQFFFVLKS